MPSFPIQDACMAYVFFCRIEMDLVIKRKQKLEKWHEGGYLKAVWLREVALGFSLSGVGYLTKLLK